MINVTINAHFPQMKPAHDAFITKQGEGSNLDRAVRDAVSNIFSDERLKGKKADNIMPVKLTVAVVPNPLEDAKKAVKNTERRLIKAKEEGYADYMIEDLKLELESRRRELKSLEREG
jgi:hypothetical protein